MRVIAATIAAALALAGCSASTNTLLKEADPSACATKETRKLILEDIRNGVSLPDDLDDTPELARLKELWLDDVDLSLEAISAEKTDPSRQTVSCSARVKLVAEGVENPVYTNVDWQLKANLASDDPLISLNGYAGRAAMGGLFRAMAAPLYQKQKERKDTARQQGRENFARQNEALTDAAFDRIKATYVPDAFTDSQMRMMALHTTIGGVSQSESERDAIDTRGWWSEIEDQLRDQNICALPEGEFSKCRGDNQEIVRARVLSPQQSTKIAAYKAARDRCMFESLSENAAELCAQKDALEAKMTSIGLCSEDDGGSGRWVPCAGVITARQ